MNAKSKKEEVEILRKPRAVRSPRVIGPIVSGSSADNIHDCSKSIWRKFSEAERVRFNNLYSTFWDSFNYHPKMTKDKMFDEYRKTIAHNFACLVVWDEKDGAKK